LYTLVISSTNGDMYVWLLLSNNAIVLYVLVKYLWLRKEAMMNHRYLARNPKTMKTVTNLFLNLFTYYTLAIFLLLSAFSIVKALPRSLQGTSRHSHIPLLLKSAYNF
jgi:hypothetical protein